MLDAEVPFDWLYYGTGIFGIVGTIPLIFGLIEVKKKSRDEPNNENKKIEKKRWKQIIIDACKEFKHEKRLGLGCWVGFCWYITDDSYRQFGVPIYFGAGRKDAYSEINLYAQLAKIPVTILLGWLL